MPQPDRMKFGIFLAPFHELGDNPTLALQRDLQLIERLDELGYDEAWIGEHHSAGWETVASPEIFIAAAAQRTKHIKLGTGVVSLPYHHPLIVADRMVLLDHLTRGRVMFGVGPGALPSDAWMMGIDPTLLRPRMEEALGVILRLFKETEPFSHQTEWFTLRDARLQMRPYTQPHMPLAVSAVASPAGMVAAGKYGTGILTFALPRGDNRETALKEFWGIAVKTADEHGNTMDRGQWRIVLHVHLAESRKEAIEQVKVRAGRYQREYVQTVLGIDSDVEGPPETVAQQMVDRDLWCVGTPDDLVAMIGRLQERSGGFGGLMVQATEWGTREEVFRSYELLARYVMPQFQGSLVGLEASEASVIANNAQLKALRQQAIQKAREDYAGRTPA